MRVATSAIPLWSNLGPIALRTRQIPYDPEEIGVKLYQSGSRKVLPKSGREAAKRPKSHGHISPHITVSSAPSP